MNFFDKLHRRFDASGDFAQAYVLADEIGHHVQTLLGISARNYVVHECASKADTNALSVRQELQAHCLAGLWAHHAGHARALLDAGGIDEALGAASAIGDDRLQRQMQGQVVPDYFTHGTSAQRTRWFRMGIARDSFETRDTYFAKTLLSTRTGLDTRPAQSTITSWSNPCPDDSTVNAFC